MFKLISKITSALLSNSALQDAYDRRQRKVKGKNNRTFATVFLVSSVLLGLMIFAGEMVFVERDSRSYLESRNRVKVINGADVDLKFSAIDACIGKERICAPFELESIPATEPTSWEALKQRFNQIPQSVGGARYVRLNFSIRPKNWETLSEFLTLTISLPNMKYYRAAVYLNQTKQRMFFLSRPINFPFETKNYVGRVLEVDVLLESTNSEKFAIGVSQPLFISTQSEFEKFTEHVILQRSGRGNWVAVISRITLALFAIGLFLLIDSSTESLGLALFMGFEALGIAARHGWLPLSALGPWWDLFASALFTNLGLIFRLYFYLNLARVAGASLHRWFIGALLWSVPMAYYAMDSGNRPESLYGVVYATCGLAVALLGMAFCLRSYAFIRKRSLHWRHMALMSAALAAMPSVIISLDAIFPNFITDSTVVDVINTLHFNSGFILALSAFFNISSLENRVRSLSIVQMKAKQLEMELELARSVQKQHMRVPKMPDQISVECFQSAASYVSGDTYFFDWDEKASVFTFVLNDVTGHGVQAALKATICNVIAELVWVQGAESKIKDNSEFSIARYNQLICKYLSERFHANDLHSICGGEFNLERGELCLYRSNAPSPLILQPSSVGNDQSQKYEVLNVPLRNQTVSKIQLRPGAMVIVMSDGILFSSREQANIARRLSEMVSVTNPDELSLEQVKETITATNLRSNQSIDDDKTLLIFRWNPRRAKIKAFKIAG